ncbi:MAG: tRNA (cytidine/uridine-2'-O-)-methyltransferase TrmJ [bacterium ADurb.Bin374]|nr:MAG: tRNA (cytidine/uridine-2'-O-)-methyltransferase TrmJ [bacterium ADurb.Bin374]
MKNRQPLLKNIRIVLVEPQGAMNVGSVCRAMKNFGLRELVLVRPGCELNLDAIKMALTARDILESARIVDTIPEAVAGSLLVLGTSNRHGEYHEPHMTVQKGLERVGPCLSEGPVSILFGREEWGLTKEDLKFCQGTMHIVTDPEFTSMNLAQAVLLISYELYQKFGVKPVEKGPDPNNPFEMPATFEELQRLYDHMLSVLKMCHFLPTNNPDGLFQLVRAFIHRSQATHREINILMGIFSNVEGFMRIYVHGQKRQKDKSGAPPPPLPTSALKRMAAKLASEKPPKPDDEKNE